MADEPGLDAYPKLQGHILSRKEFGPLLRSRARAKHQAEWRDLIRALAAMPPSSAELPQPFPTHSHVSHPLLPQLPPPPLCRARRPLPSAVARLPPLPARARRRRRPVAADAEGLAASLRRPGHGPLSRPEHPPISTPTHHHHLAP